MEISSRKLNRRPSLGNIDKKKDSLINTNNFDKRKFFQMSKYLSAFVDMCRSKPMNSFQKVPS